jgi:uncharacterized protein YndB with AHSA1/START domain
MTLPVRSKANAVYKALTSARELCAWWLKGAETAATNGGRFRMVWPKIDERAGLAAVKRGRFPPQASSGEGLGVFIDLDLGRRVSWQWRLSAYKRRRIPPLTSFLIAPAARGVCRLTLLHAGFSARPDAHESYRRSRLWWEDCLTKLKLYLETGKTRKTEFLSLDALRKPSHRR